jgi:hypothetical protein
LQYGVAESNEHGVFVRGKTRKAVIELPDHWEWLVNKKSITVQLTPIKKFQPLFVESADNEKVVVGGATGEYSYVIHGTRKDVKKLKVDC